MRRKKLSINEEDEQEAAEELAEATDETPTDVIAPEVSAKTEDLTTWDEAPESHGKAAPKVMSDDDTEDDTIAAKLVYEGTDEAERERRIAAADPDYEP